MTATILVCGANGQVGKALCTAPTSHRIVGFPKGELDITTLDSVKHAFDKINPAIVINAAAYTQVDGAEKNPGSAFAVNRDGVANLGKSCRDLGVPLLHISTDYVFDGKKSGPWVESDPIAPLGIYGKSKAEGEAVLRRSLKEHIILRTSWVFASGGNNFVNTMLRLGRERDELAIVDDQHGCPTSARSIAEVLLAIAGRFLDGLPVDWGIYHYCNTPATTWFDFAREIFRQARYENLVLKAISTDEYPTPATRPQNSVLDCTKIKALGVDQACWKAELKQVLEVLDLGSLRPEF